MTTSQIQVEVRNQLLGQSMKRVEDPRLCTGKGEYIDDVRLTGMLYVAFVRSPYAHAKIIRTDTTKTAMHPKVRLILTGKDMEGKTKNLPTTGTDKEKKDTPRPILPTEEVNYAGETVAAVVADDLYSAQDAAELVEVEYEPLEVVQEMEDALKPDSPKVHGYLSDNIAYQSSYESGEVDRAFRRADKIVSVELLNQRVAPVPMEPRGIVANYDLGNGLVTVWISTQDPHGSRTIIADILKLPENRVRVIAPDVGGGFGAKIGPYPEDIILPYAAIQLGRPVKWVESRRENLLSMTHARGQKQYVKAAVRRDGKILALKVRIVSDGGAYNTSTAWANPYLTALMVPGPYALEGYKYEVILALTNKVPQDSYRGAGRPEANYLLERTISVIARELKLDPVKVRLLNFIKKDSLPYRSRTGFTYDTGNYAATMQRALEVSDYDRLVVEQRQARSAGRLVGLGVASWIDITGPGPESAQTAAIAVSGTGSVTIAIGGHPQGQGHVTSAVQIAAQVLGINPREITIEHGDTSILPWSSGTAGSGAAAGTGSAVYRSALKVKEKMGRIAAKMLELTNETEMIFEDRKIYPEGSPGKVLAFADVAKVAYQPHKLPKGMEPTLFEYTAFAPTNFGFPFGTHIAMVEVDKESGFVKILKYFAIDDCGKVLNPLIVEGQVHGGVVQGIGQALVEEVVYDDMGQLLTSTLADYSILSAESVPLIVSARTETPTDSNPLGVKGIGEGPTIVSTSVILNAVEDALSSFNVTVERMPLRPDYVKTLMTAVK